MKKIMFLALASVALASCTQDYDAPDNSSVNGDPAEIKLYGGVQIYSSVKAFTPGSEVTGIQFIQRDGTAPAWTGVTAATTTGILATDGTISFANKMYYPNDGTTTTNITAFYPAAKNIADGVASMVIDGTQDVLYTATVSGTKAAPIASSLTFNHLLTQFKFVIQREAASTNGADAANDIENVTVAIKDANTAFSLNLNDGELTSWGTPMAMSVSLASTTATTTASAASTPLLLQPGMGSITLTVSADGYAPQNITINGTTENQFKAGHAYTITLTFKGTEIAPSGAVSGWTEGTAEGDIQ